jgi:hypothetical protein
MLYVRLPWKKVVFNTAQPIDLAQIFLAKEPGSCAMVVVLERALGQGLLPASLPLSLAQYTETG